MRKIHLKTIMAGPDGGRNPGKYDDVPAELAAMLVKQRHAEYTDDGPQEKAVLKPQEKAVVAPAETAKVVTAPEAAKAPVAAPAASGNTAVSASAPVWKTPEVK